MERNDQIPKSKLDFLYPVSFEKVKGTSLEMLKDDLVNIRRFTLKPEIEPLFIPKQGGEE